MNNKYTDPIERLGYRLGQALVVVFLGCVMAAILGLTISFLQWIF